MARFSDIRRATELKVALDNYTNYLRNAENRPTKRLQGGAVGRPRGQREIGYILPFTREVDASDRAQVGITTRAKNFGLATLGGRLVVAAAPPAGSNILLLKRFKPATASVFDPSGPAVYVQSKITKLYYPKRPGESYSLPFGALAENEEFSTAASAVKGALFAIATGDGKRVSISFERYTV